MPGNKSYSTLPQEDLEQSAAPKHIPLYVRAPHVNRTFFNSFYFI